MYQCNYEKPDSLAAAAELAEATDMNVLLAGGMTLLPTMKQRLAQPDLLIDLGGISALRGISVTGDSLEVGAMTLHDEVARSSQVRNHVAALCDLAAGIGDAQVRNRGTLGGSIANNDPAADYPAALLALGATVVTNRREISADEFFTGMFETALQQGEVILAVRFDKPVRAGYSKFAHPASRYAVTGVFVAQGAGGVRVAVTGASSCVYRDTEIEKRLGANFSASALEGLQTDHAGFNEDLHFSAEYRAHLVGIMAGRAVSAALDD